MKTIAVIGAGTMGSGIAHTFALNGFVVKLIDKSEMVLDKAMDSIAANLNRMVAKGTIAEQDFAKTITNIITYTDIEDGVVGVDFVIEAVAENKDLKLKIFKQINALCSHNTIFASNTSSISIAELASVVAHPDRVIGMHFMNPVPMMPLVEIVKSKHTSEEVTNITLLLAEKLVKKAIVVHDAPGFVTNRILMPMINEAIETLADKVAGVAAIDSIMKTGMGHPMGPLQLADLIGLDVCLSILKVLHESLRNPKYQPNALLQEMVNSGRLGVKTGIGFYDYSESNKATIVASQFLS